MQPDGSLLRLQVPATCPYPQPGQSSSCPPAHPTSWRSILILSSHPRLGLPSPTWTYFYLQTNTNIRICSFSVTENNRKDTISEVILNCRGISVFPIYETHEHDRHLCNFWNYMTPVWKEEHCLHSYQTMIPYSLPQTSHFCLPALSHRPYEPTFVHRTHDIRVLSSNN